MTKTAWLSFDLGVNGDYDGLYGWPDNHSAEECGDNIALIRYETSSDLVVAIRQDLNSNVKLNTRSRVYMIYRGPDNTVKGAWLFGKRKQAPWTGYGGWTDGVKADEG